MERPTSKKQRITKHLWYKIIIRMPALIQENIHMYKLDNNWDAIVLHYWTKRFHSMAIESGRSVMERYRHAALTQDVTQLKHRNTHYFCVKCGRTFSDVVDVCFKCHGYTCVECAVPALREFFPDMKYPTSCPEHTMACHRCEQPFIKIENEDFCFECQLETEIYEVKWQTYVPRSWIRLPYGSMHIKRQFNEFLHRLEASVLITNIAPVGGYNIAIGRTATAIGNNYVIPNFPMYNAPIVNQVGDIGITLPSSGIYTLPTYYHNSNN